MDDNLKFAALAAAEAQRHEIQQATLDVGMGLLEVAFLAGVEWMRQQKQEDDDA